MTQETTLLSAQHISSSEKQMTLDEAIQVIASGYKLLKEEAEYSYNELYRDPNTPEYTYNEETEKHEYNYDALLDLQIKGYYGAYRLMHNKTIEYFEEMINYLNEKKFSYKTILGIERLIDNLERLLKRECLKMLDKNDVTLTDIQYFVEANLPPGGTYPAKPKYTSVRHDEELVKIKVARDIILKEKESQDKILKEQEERDKLNRRRTIQDSNTIKITTSNDPESKKTKRFFTKIERILLRLTRKLAKAVSQETAFILPTSYFKYFSLLAK